MAYQQNPDINLNQCAKDTDEMFNITEERREELRPTTDMLAKLLKNGVATPMEYTASVIELGKTEYERLYLAILAGAQFYQDSIYKSLNK